MWCPVPFKRVRTRREANLLQNLGELLDLRLAQMGHVGDYAEGRSRTADTRIFSPLLYHLSYLGAAQF